MKIAQISDTHIEARDSDLAEGRQRADSLRRCVADINRVRPDLVLHTGDTVQNGLPEEYDHLREILAPLDAPIYLVPGNRDSRPAFRAAFGDHSHLPKEGDFLHYTVERYAARLVALDSTHPEGQTGAFCDRRQAWLDDVLSGVQDRPTILFIHHPPFDIGDFFVDGYRRRREAEDLTALVRRHPHVVRLLCGHVHRSTEMSWAGTRASTMTSVAIDKRQGVDARNVDDHPEYQLHVMSEPNGLVSQTRIVTC